MINAKLLIIDDEAEYASTLCQRLLLRGIDAIDVHSGKEGLAKVAEISPDVVVLDLKMPDMSGLDVLEEIKKYNPNIEVIMVTGHGSSAAGIKAMEKGAFDYIMKPFNLSVLLEKVKSAYMKINEK